MARDPAELQELLEEQLSFLRTSCRTYDAGDSHEAKRLAATLRTLPHDTGKSHALLAQMGILESTRFLDSAGPVDPANLLPTMNLTAMEVAVTPGGVEARYVAHLNGFHSRPNFAGDTIGQHLPFGEWWTEPIMKDTEGTVFTRKDPRPRQQGRRRTRRP